MFCRRTVSNSVDHLVSVLVAVWVADGIVKECDGYLVGGMHRREKQQYSDPFLSVLLWNYVQQISMHKSLRLGPHEKNLSVSISFPAFELV